MDKDKDYSEEITNFNAEKIIKASINSREKNKDRYKNKFIFGKAIIIWLVVIFSCITSSGILLMRQSTVRRSSGNSDDSAVKVGVSKNKLSIDIISAIPGIFIFVGGITGLILLLIKVPVKRLVEYEYTGSSKEGESNLSCLSHLVLSEKTEMIPWLVWFSIRSRGIVYRVRE